MLKIRLQRFGKKKYPIYRIAVMHSTVKRDGKPVEKLGFYNPHTKELILNEERFNYWKSVGAQVTETVAKLASRGLTHNLADGHFKFVAKTREEKEELKAALKAKNTKVGKAEKKRKEAEEEAAKAKAEEEAAAKEAAEAEKTEEAAA
ncbi:MAG: 30S ribosomal protein S16 [Candidatus Caenarcaniphilales bacterium]|nr:30S ribosomal protein S16 [Candidatus Caenarcaniphilales bacterium]